MPLALAYILLGVVSGLVSGVIGIGGGIIIVPCLVFLFGLSQQQAQGTTLALLVPPIGLLAAWTYYKQGYVDLKIAGLIILGFVAGSWQGAKVATHLPTSTLQRIFGAAMILIGLKLVWPKN